MSAVFGAGCQSPRRIRTPTKVGLSAGIAMRLFGVCWTTPSKTNARQPSINYEAPALLLEKVQKAFQGKHRCNMCRHTQALLLLPLSQRVQDRTVPRPQVSRCKTTHFFICVKSMIVVVLSREGSTPTHQTLNERTARDI
jgi:hypothetical protein